MNNKNNFNYVASTRGVTCETPLSVPLNVNGVGTVGWLDTGSANSIISLDFIERCNWRFRRDECVPLLGAGGNALPICGSVQAIVELAGREWLVTFQVVERFAVDVLIGVKALFGGEDICSISGSRGRVTIKWNDSQPHDTVGVYK